MTESVLEVSAIETAYGLSQVLFGVSISIAPGEPQPFIYFEGIID